MDLIIWIHVTSENVIRDTSTIGMEGPVVASEKVGTLWIPRFDTHTLTIAFS